MFGEGIQTFEFERHIEFQPYASHYLEVGPGRASEEHPCIIRKAPSEGFTRLLGHLCFSVVLFGLFLLTTHTSSSAQALSFLLHPPVDSCMMVKYRKDGHTLLWGVQDIWVVKEALGRSRDPRTKLTKQPHREDVLPVPSASVFIHCYGHTAHIEPTRHIQMLHSTQERNSKMVGENRFCSCTKCFSYWMKINFIL